MSLCGSAGRWLWRRALQAPSSVRVMVTQDAEGWLLHLIHIQKESDSMYLDDFERIGPMEIRVNPSWPVRAVTECLSGRSLSTAC